MNTKYKQQIIGLFVCCFALLQAFESIAQSGYLYYVPMSEQGINGFFHRLDTPSDGDDVINYISISVAIANTVIYYDHWEDGYETDITNPVQSTTEVWGDAMMSNGVGENFFGDKAGGGELITLLSRSSSVDGVVPSPVIYNGRDKIYATQPINIVRAAWDFEEQTLLAGSVAAQDTSLWNTCFKIPVNQSSNNFELMSFSVMALEDNTTISFDGDKNGVIDLTATIDEGEGYSAVTSGSFVEAGGTITSTAPIQVTLMTGDIDALYESRFYQMVGCDDYADTYYCPVPSSNNGPFAAPTRVYMYNDDNVSRTITVTLTGGSTTSFSIPAGDYVLYDIPQNTAACLEAPSGSNIYPIGVYGSNDADFDWGFELIPEAFLQSSVYIGMGQGADPTIINNGFNGSPIFASVTDNSYLFVDWNNDGVFDVVDLNGDGDTNDVVGGINESTTNQGFFVNKLQSLRFFDLDADQSGALITSRSSQDIASVPGGNVIVAWGQDRDAPDYTHGSPNQDWGYTPAAIDISPKQLLSDLSLDKTVSAATPKYGDTVTFTITLTNDFASLAADLEITDVLPTGFTYVGNETLTDGTFDDSNAPTLVWSVPTLAANGTQTLTFQAEVVESPIPDAHKNTVQITDMFGNDVDSTPNNDDGDQSEDDESAASVTPQNPVIGLAKMLKQLVSNPDGTYDATFVLFGENLGDIPLYDLSLTDNLTDEFGTYQATLADVDAASEYSIVAAPTLTSTNNAIITGLNNAYNGMGNLEILSPANGDVIGVDGDFTIEFTIRFYPDAAKNTFANQGRITGDSTEDGTADEETIDLSDASGCPCGNGGSGLNGDGTYDEVTGTSGSDFGMISDYNCNGVANEPEENDPNIFDLSNCIVKAGTLGY